MEIVFDPDKYGFAHSDFGRNGLDTQQAYFVWFRATQGETEYLCFVAENALTDSFGATPDEKDLLSAFERNRSVIEEKARRKILSGGITAAKSVPWSTGKEVWLRRSYFPDRADHLVLAARFITAAQEKALSVLPLLRRGNAAGVEEASKAAARMAAAAASRLRSAGVPKDAFIFDTPPAQGEGLSMDELARLDSPEVRALLDGVRALVPLAEKVDQTRGHWYPDASPTDTRGTDLAKSLHQIACRLRLEVEGTKCKE